MILILLLGISFTISSCANNIEPRSLFSWSDNEVLDGSKELFITMKNVNLNTLYQNFSGKLTIKNIELFLTEAKKQHIRVSLLDGDPKWALNEDGDQMIRTINRVIEINKELNKEIRIKSIIFDIEPYLLKEWDEKNREEIMNSFIKGIKAAYKIANNNNLEVIICIPYFYDNMGLNKQLEEIIESGSDGVAIMNYMKSKEVGNISTEVEFADKYEKKVINIYELQAPGQHGLKDKNTYYKDGIESVEKSFKVILEQFSGKDISIAFHEYKALKDVLEREKNLK